MRVYNVEMAYDHIMVFNVLELFGIQIIQWLGGSDKRSVWGIQIPYIFPMKWGAN